jgi:hypothetical protein
MHDGMDGWKQIHSLKKKIKTAARTTAKHNNEGK